MAVQPTVRRSVSLDPEMIEAFRSSLRGTLLLPGDEGYDAARAVWNGMIDRRPGLIVQPAGVADVVSAVNLAREHDLLLAVKGGGHNVAGNAVCDDGLLLDMSSMRAVHVDPRSKTAYVEGGAQWGDFDHETAPFKLASTGGIISTTGVAGLTLGGGIGWLNPKFGASCDNVLAYDVVLADGSYVRASADDHSDLFWALKGGGGNFGVVTGFLFQLHPFSHEVLAGARFYPVSKARELLDLYRKVTVSSSRDVVAYCAIWLNPATGENACALPFCHSGDPEAADQEMAPVREFGEADLDIIGRMPYTAWQAAFNGLVPHGRSYYWKALLFTELTDPILDIMAEHGAKKPNPNCYAVMEQFGGAYGDVGKSETAFWHRDIRHQIVIGGAWDDPAEQERCIAWVRAFHDAMAPHAATGRNLNFTVVEEGEKVGRVQASYGDNYARLVEIKNQYDSANLFRVNNNIRPTM